ncbi:hypothetical protein YC2023_019682 [Brassica napus]|uniref:(rape) hypothetical protein n=1 Tax=Brassica napus TaxID=3708 RepID=A0A816KGJ7_BRANA|nr:unnamed protein product [Brassica napus]
MEAEIWCEVLTPSQGLVLPLTLDASQRVVFFRPPIKCLKCNLAASWPNILNGEALHVRKSNQPMIELYLSLESTTSDNKERRAFSVLLLIKKRMQL